jgi:hypothetical protein
MDPLVIGEELKGDCDYVFEELLSDKETVALTVDHFANSQVVGLFIKVTEDGDNDEVAVFKEILNGLGGSPA